MSKRKSEEAKTLCSNRKTLKMNIVDLGLFLLTVVLYIYILYVYTCGSC